MEFPINLVFITFVALRVAIFMKTNIIIFDKQDITRLGIEFLISKLYRLTKYHNFVPEN